MKGVQCYELFGRIALKKSCIFYVVHRINSILLLGGGESDHPHLLGILPDFKHWSLSLFVLGRVF